MERDVYSAYEKVVVKGRGRQGQLEKRSLGRDWPRPAAWVEESVVRAGSRRRPGGRQQLEGATGLAVTWVGAHIRAVGLWWASPPLGLSFLIWLWASTQLTGPRPGAESTSQGQRPVTSGQ